MELQRVGHDWVTSTFTTIFPAGASGKRLTCQCKRHMRHRLNSWVGRNPWRRKWQPTQVFLFRESHGQRSLVGYSPLGQRVGHNWSVLAHTHWPNIPGSYAILFFYNIRLYFTTRHIYTWASFPLWPSHFILSEAISNCLLVFSHSILDTFQF